MQSANEYIFGLKNGMTQSRSDYLWASEAVRDILSLYLTEQEMQEREIRFDYTSAVSQVVDEMMGKYEKMFSCT